MIKVNYTRHHIQSGTSEGDVAYFPNWQAAMILTSRWNNNNRYWAFEITKVKKQPMFDDHDPQHMHADVWAYRHLWDTVEE